MFGPPTGFASIEASAAFTNPQRPARMIMERGGGGGVVAGWVHADPRSAAFYCSTPKGFIMPFVITLTAVNTRESFYVPDQCERSGPVINQGRNLLWGNLTLFIKDNSRAPLKCHTIYLWHNLPAVLQTGLARFLSLPSPTSFPPLSLSTPLPFCPPLHKITGRQ